MSKEYFEDTFLLEMGAKIADIPDENLITPPAYVAAPALLGLEYTFGEPDLKELYLNLLANASDDRRSDQVHPAFAEIIRQLTPKETRLLNATLTRGAIPVAQVKEVSYYEWATAEGSYDWVETRPEYLRLAEQPEISNLKFDEGLMRSTDFGREFFHGT